MEIEYRAIPGYTGYRAGSDGSIWGGYYGEWKQLLPKPDDRGRRRVILTNDNGERIRKFVSYFILLAFVGPQPDNMEACHNNGDCTDNNKNNLRWDTHANNEDDKYIHGTRNFGECEPNAKLTNAESIEIIKRRETGELRRTIAEDYGITVSGVDSVIRRKNNYAL